MTNEPCPRCNDTGWVPTDMKAKIMEAKNGNKLVLDAPVPVSIPCQLCQVTGEGVGTGEDTSVSGTFSEDSK